MIDVYAFFGLLAGWPTLIKADEIAACAGGASQYSMTHGACAA